MRIRVYFYLVFMTFVSLHIASASQIEINIKDKVTVKEKIITIADISTVTGDDAALVERINNTEVGKAPWPNNQRRIDRDFLKMRLMALNIDLSDIAFKGTRAVRVSVESTKITGDEIVQEAKEYLLSVLPSDDRETTIELERMPEGRWVTGKRDEIILDVFLADTARDRGNVEVIVSAISNDISSFKVPVFFKVRVFEYIVVTKEKIGRQKSLTKENILLARRETTRIRGFLFKSIDDVTGKSASRTIYPNTIITDDIIEIPLAVKKGSIVKMFIKTENFSIVTKGLAQGSGRTGDVIQVESIGSKKVVYGRIIDSNNVQVIF